MIHKFIVLFLSIFFLENTSQATTYYLKTNTYGNWEDACNWYTNPNDPNGSDCNGYPGIDDVAYMNSHSSATLTQPTVVGTLIMTGFGSVNGNFSFTVLDDATLYSSNGISVNNKVNILGNLHFYGGTVGGTDTAFVHGLTYFHGGGMTKPLVMLGGGEWLENNIGLGTADGFLINPSGAVFHIHNLTENVACVYDSGGEFKNFGTVIKDTDKNLTFSAPASMTGGEMHLLAGLTTFMNNFPCTNSQLTVSDGATLDFNNGARIFTNSSLNSAGYVKMKSTDVFNVGCSVSFDTLYCYGSGGPAFHIPVTVPNLIMAGGAAWFYEPLTITGSFWWINGHFYGGATINCLPLAHLVEDGGSASYTSCKFNFIGGAEWTSGNYEMNGGAEFNFPGGADFLITNNGGSISQNGGSPLGAINLTPLSILTKQGAASTTLDVYVNSNQSQFLIQQGGLALFRGTHDDSYFQIAPTLVLNCYQNGNIFNYSEITGGGIFRETGFYSIIDNSTTLDCHLEMTGGDLHVRCPITPLSLKITGGELRGAGMISVAGNFDWTGNGLITGTNFIDVQGFTTMSGSGGRLMYGEIKMNGSGSWGGTFTINFGSTGIIRVPAEANLTLSPTTTTNNQGTQNATCGIIVEGTLVKTTNFEFDMQGADLTNNGSIHGIGSFRTWNNSFVHPNTGNLSPGTLDTTGTLVWNGLFENKPAGNLVFDFENDGGQITGDSLRFLHTLTLGGTLTVNADPCWPSFEKTILTWAGTKSGNFANVILPDNYTLQIDEAAKKIRVIHAGSALTITCPENIVTATASGVCTAAPSLGLPENNNEACFPNLVFSNEAPLGFPVGMTTVEWTATAPGGSSATCAQTVEVSDAEVPALDCPDDLSVNTDAGQCFATLTIANASATDNCGIQNVSNDAPETFSVGTTEVFHTATDVHGNTSYCIQNVVVSDDENPEITCPENIVTTADPQTCTAEVLIANASATDNCEIQSILFNAPEGFSMGTTTIVHTATDIHGNTSSCEQTVTVEAPAAEVCNGFDDDCDGSIDEDCGGGGPNDDDDSDGIPNSEDNCVSTANPDQADLDGDDIGDVCDGSMQFCNAVDNLKANIDALPDPPTDATAKFWLNTSLDYAKLFFEMGEEDWAEAMLGPSLEFESFRYWIYYFNASNPQKIPNSVKDYLEGAALDLIASINDGIATCNGSKLQTGTSLSNDAPPTVTAASMIVFPNPTHGEATIHLFGLENSPAELAVFDQLGRVVHRQTVEAGTQRLDLDLSSKKLGAGFFNVRLKTQNQTLTQRLSVLK